LSAVAGFQLAASVENPVAMARKMPTLLGYLCVQPCLTP
jgi:hypothetical protein